MRNGVKIWVWVQKLPNTRSGSWVFLKPFSGIGRSVFWVLSGQDLEIVLVCVAWLISFPVLYISDLNTLLPVHLQASCLLSD